MRMLRMAEAMAAQPDSDPESDGDDDDAAAGELMADGGAGASARFASPSAAGDALRERRERRAERARRADAKALARTVLSLRERLHLADPRLFNRDLLRAGEVPAANGHFTARALARFYSCLGQPLYLDRLRRLGQAVPADLKPLPQLLPVQRLRWATRLHAEEKQQMNLFTQGGWRTRFGLGYQLYLPLAAEAAVAEADSHEELPFGHSGFGGSLAFFDPTGGYSVAITVNRLSSDKEVTVAIVKAIAEELGGVSVTAF